MKSTTPKRNVVSLNGDLVQIFIVKTYSSEFLVR